MPRPNAKVKSVHFNITVQEDNEMLQHIGNRNFSKYVKELIKGDMKKGLHRQPSTRGGIKYLPK
jgi:hypothetical protein